MKTKFTLAEIHDKSFEEHVIVLTVDDIKALAERKNEFRETNCPACESKEASHEYEIYGLGYMRCHSCRTVYLSPCPPQELIMWYLETSSALKFWRERMPESIRVSRKSKLYAARADFVIEHTRGLSNQKGILVDVGAGNGEFAEEMASRALFEKIVVVEPQPLSLDHPHIEVATISFEEFSLQKKADVIVAFEVLEHIIDPELFLKKVHDLLADDGSFVFSTPNIDGFETSTLGRESRAWWFDHVRLYNPESIKVLLERFEFEVLDIQTPGHLDVEIVARAAKAGKLDLRENPALGFLLDSEDSIRSSFQAYLRAKKLSSHMACVARKQR